MSASRRRKTPDRKGKKLVDEQLDAELPEAPELEPVVDELETLEPIEDDDSPVRVTHAPADEPGFDLSIEVHVPDMEKKAVPKAVSGPLRRAVGATRAGVRWRNVLVRFTGDAVIGSAVKDLVAATLKPERPLRVVVRRGFGDETVHQGEMPTVKVTTRVDGDLVRLDVATGELDSDDLPFALAPELAKLAVTSSGKRLAFAFTGETGPGEETRERIHASLSAAGAVRVTVDGDLLFDRELERRVRVTGTGETTEIAVAPADDEEQTIDALGLVLPASAERLAGRCVRVRFEGKAPRTRELARLLELCAESLPSRIELDRGTDDADVIWPRLLKVAARDDEAVIGVIDGGRGPSAIVAAFRREVQGFASAIAGRHVTVDWPTGFALDPRVEQACLLEALGALGPRHVACSFRGEGREPFLPAPLTFDTAPDGTRTIRLDTDTGKPTELVRAIERRVRAHADDLRGECVRVTIAGSGAVSRSVSRSLRESIEGVHAARLELDDHGAVDVLVPPLLTIGPDGAGVVRITADATGRNAAQVEAALQRELDAAEITEGAAFTIEPCEIAYDVVAAVVARGASRVVLDGDRPVQVHPALFGTPEREVDRLTLRATPGDDAGVVAAQLERELPPILEAQGDLKGVDVTVVWPGAADPQLEPVAGTLHAVLARGPRRLLLDTGGGPAVQLFPEIVPEYVTVLGRKDGATPPLVLLGIDQGIGEDHAAKVLAKLTELAGDVEGRRVLVVLRDGDRDVAVTDDDALIAAVRAELDAKAAATLVFRGRDPHRRPYFEVVHSTLEQLAIGAKVGDPRPRG